MYERERAGEIKRVGLRGLQPGDSIQGRLVAFEHLFQIPYQVAEEWARIHPGAISLDGRTPESCPVKDWDEEIKLVVGTPFALPGEARVCVLVKAGDTYRLYRSRETVSVQEVEVDSV